MKHQRVTRHLVDEAVCLVDSPRPHAGEIPAQRLGLADSRKRVSLDVPDELVDALEHLVPLCQITHMRTAWKLPMLA